MPFSSLHHLQNSQVRAVAVGVYFLCAWMWGLGWLMAALMLYQGVHDWRLFAVHISTGPLAWGAIWQGRKGHWREVSLALVAFILTATAQVHLDKGVYTTASLMNLAVLTLFTGWSLGWAATVVVVALCQMLLVLLVLQGMFSWNALLPLMFTSLLLGLSMVLARNAYDRHVQQLQVAARRLSEHEAYRRMLSSVVEQSPCSMLVVDVHGCIVYANTAFCKHMGYGLQEVLGRKSRDISVTGMDVETYDTVRQVTGEGRTWHGVLRNTTKSGSTVVESVMITPIYDTDGCLLHYVEVKLDISEKLHAQERIHQLLHYDKLTQLPNRLALWRRLEHLLQQESARLGRPPSNTGPHIWHGCVMFGIDRFNALNAAKGSAWGDALLQALALRLQELQVSNTQFWAARQTTDQFVVVVEHIGSTHEQAKAQVQRMAVQLQGALSNVELCGEPQSIEISMGVGTTVFPFVEPSQSEDSPDLILRRSAVALSSSRQKGLGQLQAYSEELAKQAEDRLQMDWQLRSAVEQGQLRMYVQPQYDSEGHVTGMESLVRWEHPDRGLLPPGLFMPVAEESGLDVRIGEWMLEQACVLLSVPLMQERAYSVSVNISAQHFMHPDFVAYIQHLLQRTGIAAERLTLEVTETMLLEDLDEAVQIMSKLQTSGLQFALDDFGTGYSSLTYLQRLPIQEIKIDQSFIRGLEADESSTALVRGVLNVAQQLGLRVVAEGVEQKVHVQLLQAWCPDALCQGYWYCQPMPATAWLQVLGGWPPEKPVGRLAASTPS